MVKLGQSKLACLPVGILAHFLRLWTDIRGRSQRSPYHSTRFAAYAACLCDSTVLADYNRPDCPASACLCSWSETWHQHRQLIKHRVCATSFTRGAIDVDFLAWLAHVVFQASRSAGAYSALRNTADTLTADIESQFKLSGVIVRTQQITTCVVSQFCPCQPCLTHPLGLDIYPSKTPCLPSFTPPPALDTYPSRKLSPPCLTNPLGLWDHSSSSSSSQPQWDSHRLILQLMASLSDKQVRKSHLRLTGTISIVTKFDSPGYNSSESTTIPPMTG